MNIKFNMNMMPSHKIIKIIIRSYTYNYCRL